MYSWRLHQADASSTLSGAGAAGRPQTMRQVRLRTLNCSGGITSLSSLLGPGAAGRRGKCEGQCECQGCLGLIPLGERVQFVWCRH